MMRFLQLFFRLLATAAFLIFVVAPHAHWSVVVSLAVIEVAIEMQGWVTQNLILSQRSVLNAFDASVSSRDEVHAKVMSAVQAIQDRLGATPPKCTCDECKKARLNQKPPVSPENEPIKGG